jgi:hypothetical protein
MRKVQIRYRGVGIIVESIPEEFLGVLAGLVVFTTTCRSFLALFPSLKELTCTINHIP